MRFFIRSFSFSALIVFCFSAAAIAQESAPKDTVLKKWNEEAAIFSIHYDLYDYKILEYHGCTFYPRAKRVISPQDLFGPQYRNISSLEMDSCRFEGLLEMRNVKCFGRMDLNYCRFRDVELDSIKAPLDFNRSGLRSFRSNYGKHDFLFLFIPYDTTASMYCHLDNCKVNNLRISDENDHPVTALFTDDTLTGAFELATSLFVKMPAYHDSSQFTCEVKNSYFNAYLSSSGMIRRSRITFTDCVFGPAARLQYMGFDTVILDRCIISSPVYFSFDDPERDVYISFVNTNTSNLVFNFTTKTHLFFLPATHADFISAAWENLLSKFKKEGMTVSYQNVDIAYHHYSGNWFFNFLNLVWWNYGYNKWLIILWTIGFLFLFYLINSFKWEAMQRAYDIIPEKDRGKRHDESDKDYRKRKRLSIFIYTCYIFFSLRVDFEKLRHGDRKLLRLFFAQYIVGLTCLFFIANAILKLG